MNPKITTTGIDVFVGKTVESYNKTNTVYILWLMTVYEP